MELDQIALEKDSQVPLAEQLANHIYKEILFGRLLPGGKLPPERELAGDLGISRGTVKRAYAKLAESDTVEIRQGSGTYVMANGRVLEETQKRDAAELVAGTLSQLQEMGLSNKEIRNLINLYLTTTESMQKLSIMVLSNNYEILTELEKQLGYLTNTSQFSFTLSFMTLDSLEKSHNATSLLFNYDLIVATSIDFADTVALAPMYRHKMVEATISPRTSTLIELSNLPRDRNVGVIYRTTTFCDMVTRALGSMGFSRSHVFLWHEDEYHPALHQGAEFGALIGFNEAPIFVDEGVKEANRAFEESGGTLLRFEYRIDRSSLTFIEDRIQELLTNESR